jgi:hypothetical protein
MDNRDCLAHYRCGVYLPDLEHPRPQDAPPSIVKLRLVKKA